MPRRFLLSAVAAVALAGCGSAQSSTSPPAGPPPAAAGFPVRLPSATTMAYAVRQGPLFASARKITVIGAIQALAVTAQRRAYVSCRSGAPMTAVGAVPASAAGQWARLLAAGHLGADRSDARNPQHRSFWFMAGGRLVYLDFARHVHPAPCTGTECSAALHIDSTLQALLPASAALSGFIAAHCPAA